MCVWGGGGGGVGRETEGLCLTLRCHHQNDARFKTGSGVGLLFLLIMERQTKPQTVVTKALILKRTGLSESSVK